MCNIAGMFRFILVFIFVNTYMFAGAQQRQLDKVNKQLAKSDTAKAIKKLNQAINKDPNYAPFYLRRAEIKYLRHDYDPAMADLNSYCSLIKDCAETAFLKGMIRFRLGDYNGAIVHFSEQTEHHATAEGWFYLALSHMWLQNYPIAQNAFERSLSLNKNQPTAYYNAGVAAFRSEHFHAADSLFSKAILLSPGDNQLKLSRSLALTQISEFAKSNSLLREIPETDPTYPKALYNIGVNYFNLGELDLACDYWSRAKDLGHLQADEAKIRHCGAKSQKVKKW